MSKTQVATEKTPQNCKAAAKTIGRRMKKLDRLNAGTQNAARSICFFLVEAEAIKFTRMTKAIAVPRPNERYDCWEGMMITKETSKHSIITAMMELLTILPHQSIDC
jgi:hypothetical protein